MILQQPLERGPQGGAQRLPRAALEVTRGLDARCVWGTRVGLTKGRRSFGWVLRAGLQDEHGVGRIGGA